MSRHMCDDLLPTVTAAERQRLYQAVPTTPRRSMARASFRRAIAAGVRRHGPVPASDFFHCLAHEGRISRPLLRYARQVLGELGRQEAPA